MSEQSRNRKAPHSLELANPGSLPKEREQRMKARMAELDANHASEIRKITDEIVKAGKADTSLDSFTQ